MNPQKIAILTDSCADLSEEVRAGTGIFTVPLKIVCDDGEYSDGVDISGRDIYARQAKGELPKTSLPDFETVGRTLNQIAAEGYQRVIAIMLSSGLSGTYNMVRLQGEHQKDLSMAVFDSLSGAMGMGITVLQVWEDVVGGMDWENLVNHRVPTLLGNTSAFFSVDTLEYLQKGGRIGKVTALAGTMLNIKPLLTFAPDGQLQSIAKVRGRRQVQDKLVELMCQAVGQHKRYNLAIANGGAAEEMGELREKVALALPHAEHIWDGEIDGTLSVYIGKGILGGCVQLLDE